MREQLGAGLSFATENSPHRALVKSTQLLINRAKKLQTYHPVLPCRVTQNRRRTGAAARDTKHERVTEIALGVEKEKLKICNPNSDHLMKKKERD